MNPAHIAELIDKSPLNRGMDGQAWVSNSGNIAMQSEAGEVVLFQWVGNGVYEFHWLVSGGRPAKSVVEFTLDSAKQVFLDTGCQLMYGLIPERRKDAALMARWIGAQFLGNVPTEEGICRMFILTREMCQRAKPWVS